MKDISTKKIAILQSNYIPWKGYFDLINLVDEFIIFDDVQYTRRDWRNRNKIKTPRGTTWLTIPVEVKGKYFQTIRETVVSSVGWAEKHWRIINENYKRAPYFDKYCDDLKSLFLNCNEDHLSEINYHFLKYFCNILGITTKISWSWDYGIIEGKTERLLDLCMKSGASEYLSGPSAKNYIQPELFKQAGVKLTFMNYAGYPEYLQLYPPFEHGVSIIDLLLHTGSKIKKFMLSF